MNAIFESMFIITLISLLWFAFIVLFLNETKLGNAIQEQIIKRIKGEEYD